LNHGFQFPEENWQDLIILARVCDKEEVGRRKKYRFLNGHISASFTNAEFTGYSKELFGLKVDACYKTLELNAFFSKTKGMSEIKCFTSNTQLEIRIFSDTSYIKLKHYSLLLNNEARTIKNGAVEVYVDYQKLDPIYNILIPIDYNTGMLIFKNTLANNYIVAVNYEIETSSGLWKQSFDN
jgi:hypothetical protein